MAILSLFDNAAIQGLTYGIGVLGLVLSFRILRFPDLTPDASYLLGSSTYAVAVTAGYSWLIATALAFVAGACAGMVTSLLNSHLRINSLLAGILTTMIAYSIGFRILGGRPNLGLGTTDGMFEIAAGLDTTAIARQFDVHPGEVATAFAVALLLALVVGAILKSEWGLLLRATGNNPLLLKELQRDPSRYQLQGLALANGLVGVSAAVISAHQGFADVNMALGIVITLIASLVIGEQLIRLFRRNRFDGGALRIVAAFVGAFAYFLLYLFVLRASILGWLPINVQPTDLKLLAAVVVALAIASRARRSGTEGVIPF